MGINPVDVIEIRATWARMAASPWAGYGLRHVVRTAGGEETAVMGFEAAALVDGLKAAGASLVETVEGWSRVVRVTRSERRVPSEEGERIRNYELGITNEERGVARPESVEEAIEQMVALGKRNQPALGKRLDAAAELVREGRVALVDSGEARIGPYLISAEGCTCGDFIHRKGWCKHRLAVRMARHLAANRFELPRAAEPEKCPQVSAKMLALIASGEVMDEARRRELAYRASGHGARDAALRMLGNGAGSLPADLARRVGIAPNGE